MPKYKCEECGQSWDVSHHPAADVILCCNSCHLRELVLVPPIKVRLLADLKDAAAQFRKYEVLHRAKNTEDSLAKAEVNRQLAERFEATINDAENESCLN